MLTRRQHGVAARLASTEIWACISVLVLSALQEAQGSATVTLRSITILGTRSWLTKPKVYFACTDGNRTDLPTVKSVMHWYPFTGEEEWQPLMALDPHECKQCGIYETLVFRDAALGDWNICADNFSRSDSQKMLTLSQRNWVNINIACLDCPTEDQAAPDTPEPTTAAPGVSLGVLIGVLIVAAAFFLTLTTITGIIFLRKDGSSVVYEEQSKMLELGHVDSIVPEISIPSVPSEKKHGGQILRSESEEDFL